MSAEARLQQSVAEQIRKAVAPLEAAVDDLSIRLAAVEGSGGPAAAAEPKKPAAGRTAKTVKAGAASAGASAPGTGA